MAAKTVALDAESYALLAKERRPRETFSDALKRIAKRNGSILDSWGMWSEMTSAEVEGVRARRASARARDRARSDRVLE